jgi:hypothetical protein
MGEVGEVEKLHAPEPEVELHPRFVVVEDDAYLNLKEVPKTEQKIEREVYGKKSTLIRRDNVGGKTCWFKLDDNLSERGKVCFAKGVSPESKDYTLQVLLNRMDKELMEDYHNSHSADPAAAEDQIHKKVQNFSRQQNLDRTVFSIDSQDDETRKTKKGKNKDKFKDRRAGRTVFYVTVGQMKHTRIFLKSPLPPSHSEVNWVSISVPIDRKFLKVDCMDCGWLRCRIKVQWNTWLWTGRTHSCRRLLQSE